MNFQAAAFLDAFLLRIVLKFVSLLPPYARRMPDDSSFQSILVVKFWGIGTILEATPLCRAIKQRYPDVPLDILTFSENRQIVEHLGLFRDVHVIDFTRGLLRLSVQTLRFLYRHRGAYSLVIDLEFFAFFSAFVTKLLGSDYSLGFESFHAARSRCYSRTVVFDHSSHVRVIFLKLLNALGIDRPTDIRMSVPSVPESKKASALAKVPGLADGGIKVAVNINASELSYNRRWPRENFNVLVSRMQRDFPRLNVILVGGRRDGRYVESFHESLTNKTGVVVAAGRLDLLEFAYTLALVDVLITNDSGPLHIAEAVGTPVVGFFGPETHNLYGPLSPDSLVFYRDLFCSPCLNTYNHKRSRCRDNQCLKLIDADDVYIKIKSRYLDPARRGTERSKPPC